jgi:hypothetical protein
MKKLILLILSVSFFASCAISPVGSKSATGLSPVQNGDFITKEKLNAIITAQDDTWSVASTALQPEDIDTEAELESVSNTQIATETEAQGYVTTHTSAYDHTLIPTALQPSDVGTAAARAAADTLDPSGNPNGLPDNAAIDAYATAQGWGTGGLATGAFDLSDGEVQAVSYMTFVAGEDITTVVPCYFKYDSGDSRTEIYKYVGDTTDTNNDTYPVVGVNMAACTAGSACTLWVGSALLARRDETSPASTDIGAALFTLGSAGSIGTTPQSTSGDHNELVAVYAGADGYDSVTGDYVLYVKGLYMNVVP